MRNSSDASGIVIARRDSEVDPGAETESESADDAGSLDEREEELELARGELERVKQEREEWLEDAERRVDVLIAEKENLTGKIEEGRKETEWVRANLEEAQGRISELRGQMEEVRKAFEVERKDKTILQTSHEEAQNQVEALQSEKEGLNQQLDEVQRSLKDVRAQVDMLQSEKQASKKSLDDATAKISALEENSRISGEHLQRLISEHKMQKTDSEKRLRDLQERHDRIQKDGSMAAGKVKDLEKAAQNHDVGRAELMRELEEQRKLLANAREEIDGYGKEAKTLAEQYETSKKALEGLRKQRDEQQGKIETLTKESDAREAAEEASRTADEKASKLQQELDSVKASLRSLTEERDQHKRDHDRTMAEKSELAQSTEDKHNSLREEHAKHCATLKGDIDDLQSKHATEIAELKAERDRFATDADSAQTRALQDAEQKLEKVKKEHEGALEESQEANKKEIEALTDKHERALDKSRQELSSVRTEHDQALGNLKQSHLTELEEQRSQHQRSLDDALAQLAEAGSTHQKNVADIGQQHQDAVTVLRNELLQAQETLDAAGKTAESDKTAQQAAIDEARAQLSEVKDLHEQNLAELGRTHQSALSTLRQELTQARETMASAQKSAEEDVSRLRSEHANALADAESQHHSALTALKDQLAEAQTLLQSARDGSQAESTRLKSEHEQRITELEADWSTKAEQAAKEHQTNMQRAAEAAARAADSAREDFEQRLAGRDADAAVAARTHEEINAEHGKKIEALKAEHASELAVLRLEHQGAEERSRVAREKGVARLKKEAEEVAARAEAESESKAAQMLMEHEDALAKARSEHQNALGRLRDEHQASTERSIHDYDAKVSSLVTKNDQLEKNIAELTSEHVAALKNLRMDKESLIAEHARSATDVETQLHQARSEHQAEISRVKDEHIRELADLRNDPSIQQQQGELETLRAQLDKLKAEQKMVLSEKDAELGSQISTLRYEQSKALSELQGQHQNALQEQRNAFETDTAALKHSHEEALAQGKSAARKEAEERIARLEEQHEVSLRAALAHADVDLDERLRSQAHAHGEEIDQIHESLNDELQHLQSQLEEASELRHTQMEAADAENRGALAELGEKLRTAEQASAELASKHITVMAELSALQARLDAESTGHAEAERSLAQMRKLKFEEDKKSAESSDDLLQQIAALQTERDALKKRVESHGAGLDVGAATREPSVGGAAELSSMGNDEVASLQSRLADMKLESQKKEDELARQNDFLVKELESMRMHVNTPTASSAPQSDAFVQTEPEKLVQTSEQKTMPSMKQANGGAERPSTARSFEDYLQQAQVELSELGSVITANEALFAQKIQEHVGSLQLAKDQLAAEYKDRFDAILVDKERMDKDVQSKSAEEFVREHQQLAATYGVEKHENEAELPSPQKRAFRTAEEQLVKEYNRRIAKKKSRIALKHAEEFQNLTKDYDQQIAELLSNKERLEGDLSVDPSQFETDYDEMDVRSLRLEVQKNRHSVASSNGEDVKGRALPQPESLSPAPPPEATSTTPDATTKAERRRSGLPRLSSTPRTPTSIPRAVPFPGNRDSPDATSQPMIPRTPYDPSRSASDRHAPIAQRSLMRAKFPVEGHADGKRSATNPVGGGSPDADARDPVNKVKKRQLRHSSGMHFANWKEQYQG